MNIRGTQHKLGVSKSSIRELNEAEWELVGGGSASETSQQCPTAACSAGCPTAICITYTHPCGLNTYSHSC